MRIALLFSVVAFSALGQPSWAAGPAQPAPQAMVQADNQFALNLYGQLSKSQPEKNLFFSPTSISIALGMTAAGARGKTEAEMAKTLCLGENLPQSHVYHHDLLQKWNAVGEKRAYQLRVANRLWGQKGYPFQPEFLALTRDQYNAEILPVDFAQAEAARQEINRWVEQQTNDKIKDLIPSGALDALTRLVLTNAIYFKGDWVKQFDRMSTQDEDFTVSAQQKVKVPLMHLKAAFGYAEEASLQALELPYAGRELSMVVLLPKKTDGLPELEKSLSLANLEGILGRLRTQQVRTYLPRFRLETSFGLKPTLEAMGMKQAFSCGGADFSGISSKEDLYISAVIHKAFVDVNEKGTEAAAATGVVVATLSFEAPGPVFRADHPFLFLIRDMKSGSVLFLGRMRNPKW